MLADCAFLPFADHDPSQTMRTIVRTHRLQNLPCTTLLNIDDYKLLLVEKLEVPPAEMRAAIRWRIRDQIDFHIDDATVDVFDAPPEGARGARERLYVVVTRTSAVRAQIDRLRSQGTRPEIVDIPELALRNIIAQLPENSAGVAMLYLESNRGLIVLVRDSTLYLARSLDIGYQDLESADARPLWDKLSLEIQRSLDYYDRHFQQAPISQVLMAPIPASAPELADGLSERLGLPVRFVSLDEVLTIEKPVSPQEAAHCFLSVGAALRKELS